MCNNEILITSIVQSSTNIVLVPARQIPQANLTNLGNYVMRLACGLKASSALPVVLQTSAGNIPIYNKYGNTVYSNQLKTRKNYCIGYGNGNTSNANGQFTIFNCICPGTITTATTTLNAKVKVK